MPWLHDKPFQFYQSLIKILKGAARAQGLSGIPEAGRVPVRRDCLVLAYVMEACILLLAPRKPEMPKKQLISICHTT